MADGETSLGLLNDLWKIGSNDLNACNTSYWLGNVSDEWENGANWSCGSVPAAGTDVHINAGTPHSPAIHSFAICHSLTQGIGSSLVVAAGFTITITGH
jgi:hypothetical protein